MLDAKVLEDHPELLEKTVSARGLDELIPDVKKFVSLRKEWKELKSKLDALRHERNVVSQEINAAMKSGDKKEASRLKTLAKKTAESVKRSEGRISQIEEEIQELELIFPNLVSDLPKKDKVVKSFGKQKKEKWMKSYEELMLSLELIEFDSAVNMAGSGFYVLTDLGARLERALINFFLDQNSKKGYMEVSVPLLVNSKAVTNSGHLPKFKEDMFVTQEDLFLVPTSEVSLLNLHADKILREADLPIAVTAYSPCFRVEKGATKGFFRVKQFGKVEMFKFVKSDESENELEVMLKDAVDLVKLLKLPFRVLLLCPDEMSFASSKTYDIEVYSPISGWLEISSVSNCRDFQSRRGKIRYAVRNNGKERREFVHTLNGSGLAIPRTMIALIENNQLKDGSVKIPDSLHKYFGAKKIESRGKK